VVVLHRAHTSGFCGALEQFSHGVLQSLSAALLLSLSAALLLSLSAAASSVLGIWSL
jgi:hypothetical protein